MLNVLVTGGAGFIGSNFVRYAIGAHSDWHVTTLDKLTYAGRLENLKELDGHPRHTFVKGDIADADVAGPLVRQSDYVVHFAAETHVDRSIQEAGEFIKTDVIGTGVTEIGAHVTVNPVRRVGPGVRIRNRRPNARKRTVDAVLVDRRHPRHDATLGIDDEFLAEDRVSNGSQRRRSGESPGEHEQQQRWQ